MDKCNRTGCNADMVWLKVDGEFMPVNPRPSTQGNIKALGAGAGTIVDTDEVRARRRKGELFFMSHFKTCTGKRPKKPVTDAAKAA
jgi:hypothetical protein